jgi:hypothetical protein
MTEAVTITNEELAKYPAFVGALVLASGYFYPTFRSDVNGVAINRGSFGHGRFEGRRFGRGIYAYGGNYCDPYYYPYGCYGY